MQLKSVHSYDFNGLQCRLARVALGWGVRELSSAATVSQQTIVRLEKGETLRPTTLKRIRNVLEEAGIVFISEEGGRGFGILIRQPPLA
ncbi:transcriptional regulator [Ochrobactrum sp. 695/2009]|uniref:Helix-turn-helix domain-containing protein n=1 Tax=Brucella intermedia TaxID=94625 RepID=A0A7V6U050_9HYPH|nr:helix-turn-helix transcriptional regulator [Brucella intermedia]PJR92565.1 transcriptional regulator [Ochrobactrum sp. 721/2009]PJT15774.1 transcriptional regulator [Ochrobactrum sp. 720/2009]PJT18379.1 transcriptional regulator [Ochrobactrum sp. 715/2009]PJT24092.1 transcriptional regulator [Ochrobactrum sp. 695/2009]PJT33689.1 transcriptional regulator [Ochrobactrum sp. 689/2009]